MCIRDSDESIHSDLSTVYKKKPYSSSYPQSEVGWLASSPYRIQSPNHHKPFNLIHMLLSGPSPPTTSLVVNQFEWGSR